MRILTFIRPLWVLALGLSAGALNAQVIPWVMPWDDASPGITDLSRLNTPIGSQRVAADSNGHFVLDGKRVRFLGVNFAGDSPFMPTNNAEAVAARLAKFGVNAVRFHHMDASWAYNGGLIAYTSTTSTNINLAQLDRVHYVVSRLKAHGIYSDINLLVGREYRSGDSLGAEVTGMDWKDAHILGFFYDPALALHKDYATKILTPTNPFTGFPLAQDPGVAFVEILNENGLLQKWLDGGLDRLPARYAASLQARWNDWLAAKYSTDAALQAAWKISNEALGANLLANGDFHNGLTGWNGEQHENAHATFTRTSEFTNGKPSAKVNVTAPDGTGWHIQLNYPGFKLVGGQAYTVSFWAKSSPATNADLSVMQAHGNYAGLGCSQSLALTSDWQLFTNSFQATVSDTNARVNFGSMGDKLATFWFADVRLQSGGPIGVMPDGASLAARNVPNLRYSGNGYTGTREGRRDWLDFVRGLEYRYYDTMVGHLRTNVGYAGLIFGTIVANSPASVQSRMDVVDAHAYWQHPQFPGVAWDPVNWNQPNISMVNTIGDDNTLAGLARQRIKGKPFTVTEYQHPSPNYYGGEGNLLLAAYAGLQDWDGLWLFDYGQGNPVVPMGYVRSYFEIDQHPTKLASLLLAAQLFRRGDVRTANGESTMALTSDRELDLLQNATSWTVFNSSQLGVPGGLAFTSRMSTSVGTNAAGLTNPPSAPVGSLRVSDTGELRWNVSQAGKGLVTINSARTKALAGFADHRLFNLGELAVEPGTTKLGWCLLSLTLTSGEVFTNDCSMLVTATGWWENTGQVWSDTNRNSLGTHWGQAPVLTEVVPFKLTVPVGTNWVRAWSLDERGQRKAALPLTGDASSTILDVTTNAGTIWYEIDISRWVASYDLWRARYFSADEQNNPAISGPTAAPDGDGMPNLQKYYFGLPGHAPAPSLRAPTGRLFSIDGSIYPALFYQRDALANDIVCAAEVSTDLNHWYSGPAYFFTQTETGPNSLWQVIERSLMPLESAPNQYVRLRLEHQ